MDDNKEWVLDLKPYSSHYLLHSCHLNHTKLTHLSKIILDTFSGICFIPVPIYDLGIKRFLGSYDCQSRKTILPLSVSTYSESVFNGIVGIGTR